MHFVAAQFCGQGDLAWKYQCLAALGSAVTITHRMKSCFLEKLTRTPEISQVGELRSQPFDSNG